MYGVQSNGEAQNLSYVCFCMGQSPLDLASVLLTAMLVCLPLILLPAPHQPSGVLKTTCT